HHGANPVAPSLSSLALSPVNQMHTIPLTWLYRAALKALPKRAHSVAVPLLALLACLAIAAVFSGVLSTLLGFLLYAADLQASDKNHATRRVGAPLWWSSSLSDVGERGRHINHRAAPVRGLCFAVPTIA